MKIVDKLPRLSQSESYIYSYITNNPDKVINTSIQQLSKETSTSTATVLRLCRKLGCKGYSELKFKLSSHAMLYTENPASHKANSILDIRYFFDTVASSDSFQEEIDRAARLIADRELVLFVGKGASNIMGEYGSCYFSSYFKLTFRVEDIASYPIDYFSPDLVQQSVIIACSISGEYADEISYVRNYHTSGCKLIAITANRKSVLGTLADICIAYPMPLIMEGDQNITTQVPCCYIIELLAERTRAILKERELNRVLKRK